MQLIYNIIYIHLYKPEFNNDIESTLPLSFLIVFLTINLVTEDDDDLYIFLVGVQLKYSYYYYFFYFPIYYNHYLYK